MKVFDRKNYSDKLIKAFEESTLAVAWPKWYKNYKDLTRDADYRFILICVLFYGKRSIEENYLKLTASDESKEAKGLLDVDKLTNELLKSQSILHEFYMLSHPDDIKWMSTLLGDYQNKIKDILAR